MIDETGSPVQGARVHALLMRVPPGTPPPDWKPGQPSPPRQGEHLDTVSDANGRFAFVDLEGFVLQGVVVSKKGYVPVFDWSWVISDVARAHENRAFMYGGGFPEYLPDEQRPAIYPLHREGSDVEGMPSRGGSDRFADGRIVQNEPRKALIPSTGPSAPATEAERYERMEALKRSAATTPGSTTVPNK